MNGNEIRMGQFRRRVCVAAIFLTAAVAVALPGLADEQAGVAAAVAEAAEPDAGNGAENTGESSAADTPPAPELSGDALGNIESILTDTVMSVWRDFVAHLPFLLAGVAVVLLTWVGAALAGRVVRRVLARTAMRRSLKELVIKIATIATWALGLLLAAMIVFPGLTPAKALGGLGIASLAIGFAFKDIFENFFAGVILLWRFPFEHDDYIECGDIAGQVEEITVRMTMIREITGELVIVPNSFMFKNPVKILTNPARRRVGIVVGIAYDESIDEAIPLIEEAATGCDTVAGDRPVQVFAQGFGASSIDIEVVWWTEPEPVNVRRSRGQVITAVKRALDDAGIEIPFPYRTLTFKEPLPTRRVDGSDAAPEASDA